MSNPKPVLIADDDPNDVFFLRRAFKKAGFDHLIMDVRDGTEVIEYLSGGSVYEDRGKFPLPALVFLDLKMPKMTGFEVLEWLQSKPEYKNLPVVVFSSSALDTDRAKASLLGASEYRVKPNDLDELILMVKEVSATWLKDAGKENSKPVSL
jgi:CheY-like chemotaxis protein